MAVGAVAADQGAELLEGEPGEVHAGCDGGLAEGFDDARNKEIRTRARERNLDVSERGRIPADIVAQYEAAGGA